MALPTPVQHSGVAGSGSSSIFTFSQAVTAGNMAALIIYAGAISVTPTTITSVIDNKGNNWTKIDGMSTAATSPSSGYLYYLPNAVSGTTSVTVTLNQSPSLGWSMYMEEWAVTGASPLDKHAINAGTATGGSSFTTAAGPTATTSQNNELVIGWVGASSPALGASLTSPTPANDFNQASFNSGIQIVGFSDLLASSTGTFSSAYSGTYSTQYQWVSGVATFKIQAAVIPQNDDGGGYFYGGY